MTQVAPNKRDRKICWLWISRKAVDFNKSYNMGTFQSVHETTERRRGSRGKLWCVDGSCIEYAGYQSVREGAG